MVTDREMLIRLRSGYRSEIVMFQRGFKHGTISMSTYLIAYKVEGIVNIKVQCFIQEGMGHK